MRRSTSCRSASGPRDRGAAAVEFAFLLPVFAMLAIGTVTFGFAFERWINVTAAARESSRFAATYAFPDVGGAPDVNGWFTAVSEASAQNAGIVLSGPAATPASEYLICIRFVNTDPLLPPPTQQRVYGGLGGAPAQCTSSTMPSNRVEVLVRRAAPVNWLLGGDAGLSVSGDNTSPYEPTLGTP